MSQHDSDRSPFDKNLRSFLDALAMFEREAGLVLDRFGLDSDTIGRVLDTLGNLSAEAVRPLASALGIADSAAVEALARDVRALLQSDARGRREQAAVAGRVEDLARAVEALGSTTATLADLQARTQGRLDALADSARAIDGTQEQRERLLADVERLRRRIDELEERLAAEVGLAPVAEGDADENSPGAIRPAGARRPVSRTVKPSAGAQKILEGLPSLEPKVRPG
jgi:hypothetical protein